MLEDKEIGLVVKLEECKVQFDGFMARQNFAQGVKDRLRGLHQG